MSDTLDLEARAIAAKDSCPGTEGGEYNYLVEEEEGELLEQRLTSSGTEVTTVATDVKPGTPAAYLVGKTKRLVFCVSKDNILQSYSIDLEEDEYDLEPGPIVNAGIKVHPSSYLATAWSPLGAIVVYQDVNGNLSSVVASNPETWTVNGPLTEAFKPVIGTPLSIITSTAADPEGPGKLKLHYLSADEYIHYLTSPEGSERQDHQLAWANVGRDKVKRFTARYDSHNVDAKVFFYVLGSNNSFTIYSPDKVEVVGTVSHDGKIDLANKAECGVIIIIIYPNSGPICLPRW